MASLYRAAELFLTSTAGGVMPVTTLDGQPVGDGRPGPVTTALRDAYWALHTTRATRADRIRGARGGHALIPAGEG